MSGGNSFAPNSTGGTSVPLLEAAAAVKLWELQLTNDDYSHCLADTEIIEFLVAGEEYALTWISHDA